MRTRWAMGAAVLAALGAVGACRFSPAAPCARDADCGAEGRCNVATGSCYDTVCDPACGAGTACVAGVCLVGPAFEVSAAAPPVRPVPDQAGDGWHRDEQVAITVVSADAVNADSVRVEIAGVLADGGPSAWVDAGVVTREDCQATYCGAATVPLWLPEMEAYAAELRVRVVGLGTNDAPGEGSVAVAVTRQKWVVTPGGAIHGSPAIGAGGVVFVATTGVTGSVIAVNPDGTVKWAKSAFGSVEASPAVGAGAGEAEMLYVAGADAGANSFLYALRATDGGDGPKWGVDDDSPLSGEFAGALAVGRTVPGNAPSTTTETVFGVANTPGGQLFAFRPLAAPGFQASVAATAGLQAHPNGLVTSGDDAFYGDVDGRIRAYVHGSGGWVPKIAWDGTGLLQIGGAGQSIAGPTLSGDTLITAVQARGTVAVATADGERGSNYPDGGVTAAPGIPSVSAEAVFTGMTQGGVAAVFKGSVTSPGTIAASAATSAQVTAAPVLGDNDQLYTVTTSGVVQAWKQSDLSPRWSHALGSGVTASPNLGCGASAGAPGTIYVATEGGALVAIVSDSHGLDATAPWPKYQHDARNTGNPATPLACP